MIRLVIPLLCLSASAQINLPVVVSQPDTNLYTIAVTCDSVTNAQWYGGILYSNGIEIQRRYLMTNRIVFSNVVGNLSTYGFRMTASNEIPWQSFDNNQWVMHPGSESDVSNLAPRKWTTLTNVYSTNLDGPWYYLPSNSFEPTNDLLYFRSVISNFDTSVLFQRQ